MDSTESDPMSTEEEDEIKRLEERAAALRKVICIGWVDVLIFVWVSFLEGMEIRYVVFYSWVYGDGLDGFSYCFVSLSNLNWILLNFGFSLSFYFFFSSYVGAGKQEQISEACNRWAMESNFWYIYMAQSLLCLNQGMEMSLSYNGVSSMEILVKMSAQGAHPDHWLF